MSAWERPLCAAFLECFSGQGPYSGTWLWVGMDGGSQISPPLSNLVHFIMRTVVICSVSHLSCCSSGAGISGFLFLIGETEKWCEEEGKSQSSHLLSSSYSLNETGTCPWVLCRSWTASSSCGAPKTWQGDFLCPANQLWCFLAVSLP